MHVRKLSQNIMHALCVLCILFVASVNTNAQNVSVADAVSKARILKICNTISSPSNNTLSGADVSINLAYTSKDKGNTLFYVFNYADGGFAIIGGDEKAKEVLGYSDNGVFNIDSIPEGLKDMLASYSEQISYAIDNNVEVSQMNMSTTKRSIATLIQTTWNQSNPFNSCIPEIGLNYSKFVAGCAPIAAAQIMKYYNYPRSGIGSKSYTKTYNDASNGYTKTITFSADFANTIYDWDNMRNSYYSSSTSIEQQAVGLLVYHVGVAMNANYGQYATGVYTNADLPALKNSFGYDTNARKEYRSSYSNSEWENLIYNELALERPIFYAGQATDGGHAFVCDGYDSSYDWYHFNWGWGGYCDGYYPLTGSGALQPNGSGIGGAGTGSAYTSDQYALIGLCPPPPEIKVTSITLNQTSASMMVGDTRSLTATITPTNATNKNVTWSSNNTSIATVSSSGVVTAIKAGNATITATASDGSGIKAACLVTVTNNINLSDRKNVVTANTAGAIVSFSTSNTYEWEWDTTNNRMRSTNYDVNSSTSQTAINITAAKPTDLSFDYSVSSESGYDELTITLDGMTVVNAISGKNSSIYNGSLTAGSHILQLTYTKDRSSKSGDDRAYIYNLQLKSPTVLVTGISLNSTSATMTVGDTKFLTATITPTNATNKDITWSSSNTSVATVSTSGVVTAKMAGTAIITCTAVDGSSESATCCITVTNQEGDVNGDNDVDVSDVALTVEYILGHNPSGFNFAVADLDNDGMLDVADVALMVNIIMYGKVSSSVQYVNAKAFDAKNPYMEITTENSNLNVWLHNTGNKLSALQFDIVLPEDAELRDIVPSSFMNQHTVSSSILDNGMIRVLCLSMNNAYIVPDEHGVLALTSSKLVNQLTDLHFKNIIVSTPSGEKKHLNDVSLSNTTSINHVISGHTLDKVYLVNGQKRQTVQAGIHVIKTIDGKYKKIVTK